MKSDDNMRENYIDVAKGIGIILVIAGHLFPYGENISSTIFSFHMPLFFFLAGMVYKEKCVTNKEFIEKKTKRLIIPYLKFLSLGLIITLIIKPWRDELSFRRVLIDMYLAAPNSLHVGQIWFLVCLFNVSVIFFFLNKYIRNRGYKTKGKIIILIGISVVAELISLIIRDGFPYLPLKIDAAVMALVFYAFGYWVVSDTNSSFLKLRTNINININIIVLLLVVSFSWCNGWSNIADLNFHNPVLYLFFAFSGITLTVLLSKRLENIVFLQFIGRNSLEIFALHSFGLYGYSTALSYWLGTDIIFGINMPYVFVW